MIGLNGGTYRNELYVGGKGVDEDENTAARERSYVYDGIGGIINTGSLDGFLPLCVNDSCMDAPVISLKFAFTIYSIIL